MTMLQHALDYRLKHGFNVFPLSHNKVPLIPWKQYQDKAITEDEITQWWSKWPEANIGIITGSISNLLIIDLDIYKDKELINKIYNYIPKGIATPICMTPRGGMHLYFRYPEGCNLTIGVGKPVPHADYKGQGGIATAPPSVNGNGLAYTWIKARKLGEVDIQPAPIPLIEKLVTMSHINHNESHKPVEMFREGRRDDDLFHVAYSMIRGGASEEEAVYTIYNLMQTWGEKDIKWARDKVQSALKRASSRVDCIADDVRKWVKVTTGHFLVTQYHNESHLVTRPEKHAANVAFSRLCEEGIIERVGKRNGEYRLVDKTIEKMDLTSASTDPLDIRLPLGEERLVRIYRKNIIVVAGTPNAGKTAWLLNAAKMNMDKHHVLYCNSEMDVSELKVRLNEFGDCSMEKWNNVEFIERSGDYADVIQPDSLNIIDFLEISDEFWRVGGLLREIHDKLKNGIAIIGLQMNPMNFATRKRNDYGMGGARGLEKPRLYLAMHPGLMVMVKAKIWANHHVNPNGMVCRFKILHGCAFMNATEWHKETQEE